METCGGEDFPTTEPSHSQPCAPAQGCDNPHLPPCLIPRSEARTFTAPAICRGDSRLSAVSTSRHDKESLALLHTVVKRLRALQTETREVESLVSLVCRSAAGGAKEPATAGTCEMEEVTAAEPPLPSGPPDGLPGEANSKLDDTRSTCTNPTSVTGGTLRRRRHSAGSALSYRDSNQGTGTLSPTAHLSRRGTMMSIGVPDDKKQARQQNRFQAEKLLNDYHRDTFGAPGERPNNSKERRNSMIQVFPDAEVMRESVMQALKKKEYNVASLYSKTGMCSRIAKSQLFEYITLAVIALNAFWISVDTDLNNHTVLYQAPAIFQVMEHFFCIYFLFEWIVRLLACERKLSALQDRWFVFDTFLVSSMILETWIMTLLFALVLSPSEHGGSLNVSVFKLLRMLRLTRMARIARLLRAFPEMFILLKGLASAARSVLLTLSLLSIIVYMFAITFRQVTNDTYIGDKYFSSVPQSSMTLLLMGTLPDQADIVQEMGVEHVAYGLLFLAFILLGSLTVMNMLVGVLVEVVSVVSALEKEEMTVNYIRSRLCVMFDMGDEDGNGHISKNEFDSLFLQDEAVRLLQEVGVDVVGLVDLSEFIFKSGRELTFSDVCEIILQFRGSNHATVKSIVDSRKFVLQELDQLYEDLTAREHVMANFFDNLLDQFYNKVHDDLQGPAQPAHGRRPQKRSLQPSPPPPALANPEPPASPREDSGEEMCNQSSGPEEAPITKLSQLIAAESRGKGMKATNRGSPVAVPMLDDLAWAQHVIEYSSVNEEDDTEDDAKDKQEEP